MGCRPSEAGAFGTSALGRATGISLLLRSNRSTSATPCELANEANDAG